MNDKVYLVQTDTTVGFLSIDDKKLNSIKKRPQNQKILQVVKNLKYLKESTRIPNKYKNKVRRSKKTTFIYPNKKSFRVIDRFDNHYDFINKFGILYSTSANKTGEVFDEKYAICHSDIIVWTKNSFYQSDSSKIYKISHNKIIKLR